MRKLSLLIFALASWSFCHGAGNVTATSGSGGGNVTAQAGTSSGGAGTITSVTAGPGLTGGGSSGAISLNLDPNATNYIQNTNSLQSNSTFYTSSGTVQGQLQIGGSSGQIKYRDGTIQISSPTTPVTSVTVGAGLVGGGGPGAININLSPTATNYIQNTNSLQSNSTFYVSSGTVDGQFNVHSIVFSSNTSLATSVQNLNMGNLPIINIGTASIPSTSTTTFLTSGALVLASSLTVNSGIVNFSSITYGLVINAALSTQTVAGFIVKKSSGTNFMLTNPENGSMGLYDDTPINPGITIGTHVYVSGSTPTVSSCGTNPTNSGTDMVGTITVGTGGVATSCTITFTQPWNRIPKCFSNHQGAILYTRAVPSTTALVIDAATFLTAGSLLDYWCIGLE